MDAIVTDVSLRPGLVALRSLGRRGLRCCAVDSDASAPAFSSRWAAQRSVVPPFTTSPDAFADALLAMGSESPAPVVLPVHDGSIDAIEARRDDLERVLRVALASPEALAVASDKVQTLDLARTLDVPVPRSVVVDRAEDAGAAAEEIGVPAVVKPVRSWVEVEGVGRRLGSTPATRTEDVVTAVRSNVGLGMPVVVQEWLPGAREAVMLFYAQGRFWARFAQRADRTLPPLGGNSVRRESIPLPDDITPVAEELVAAMGLEGYAEVEFRRDASGQARLMEVNPRLSASVEVAVRAGVPFPMMIYQWASGAALSEVRDYSTGVQMRWLGGDIAWLATTLIKPTQLDVPSRSAAVGAFVADSVKGVNYDYLDRRDLGPAMRAVGRGARLAGRHAVRRVRLARTPGQAADTDVAIIGAGPYGLSISAHLTSAGIDHEIFGQTMDTWRAHMPKGMYLKSEGFASNLSDPAGQFTLERFCSEHERPYGRIGVPISGERFLDYGDWFQQNLVPQVRSVLVEAVAESGGGFDLRLADGDTLRARRVVVATGLQHQAHLPDILRGLPADRLIHSYDDADPAAHDGADVIVIGAGQSAMEAAVLAQPHAARVRMVARAPELVWNTRPGGRDRPLRKRLQSPESGLGEGRNQWLYCKLPDVFHFGPAGPRVRRAYGELGPAGAWWLRPQFDDVEVLLNHRLTAADANGGVRLHVDTPRGSETLEADRVIAGTGYRPDVRTMPFLDASLRERVKATLGIPSLDLGFESSVRGLHFVGFTSGASFGPLMRFVYGTPYAARRLAQRFA